jgi:hypothetical protein
VTAAIAVVGVVISIGAAIAGFVLAYLASGETGNDWLLLPLVVAAVAGPLYGTLAASRSGRWLPLAVGVAVAVGALVWLSAVADVPLELPERLR